MTIISLFICSIGVSAAQPVSIDDFLLDAGFPQNLVDTMSEIQKDIIYENSKNQIIKFAGYETQSFVLEDDELSPVQPRAGLISPSDLTVAVLNEALAQDNYKKNKGTGKKLSDARREVSKSIQIIHRYRDNMLAKIKNPVENGVLEIAPEKAVKYKTAGWAI